MSQEANARNDYVFERSLDYRHPDGSTTKLYVDCYKRGAFVLEAKQSARREQQDPRQSDMFGSEAQSRKLGHARRGSRGWDRVMRAAYLQAVDYTRHLPVEHGYPPFIILVDVGHVIELYADFSGQGKNYAQFPDAQSFRISMEDLRDEAIQARLKAVWIDPLSLDPAKKSAEVTRDIAGRLSIIAKRLEGKHDARDVAEFLMRCLFTMFAEDVGLLPEKLMVTLLEKLVDNPAAFPPAMESLWKTMNSGGFEPHSMAILKHFNGGLFANPRAIPLAPEDIHELLVAARMDWRDVEPAIFGTLLERALDPRERSKLGAHYTPRAYVERLVVPTIIEPLRADWERAQAEIEDALRSGDARAALTIAKTFHHELCTIRVLDPACGTGNFLYVSLELLKKLEAEVLEAIEELGEDEARFQMRGETVDPHQFYGLELNPRAVPIADLVLWIGYLKWQLRNAGVGSITEPVLHRYGTIVQQDAILAYDSKDLLRDETGGPVTRWDGVTRIVHPITGELVPDPEARIELYTYRNPRPAEWPEAEYIVGNPPFIGNKRMRDRLGSGYVDALHQAYGILGGSVDLVMYWWHLCHVAMRKKLRSFGLVTTNSIRQSSNNWLLVGTAKSYRIAFAVPDHPWVDEEGGAAVRVSMTVVDHLTGGGRLDEFVAENKSVRSRFGHINEKLRIGANTGSSNSLISNASLSFMGIIPVGLGFVLSDADLISFGYSASSLPKTIRRYQNGRELIEGASNRYIIDFFGIGAEEASKSYPRLWQHILATVKPFRDHVRRENHRVHWWIFGEARPAMRDALRDLSRFVGTTETAKHRIFSFVDGAILPDQKIRVVASSCADIVAILSARPHCAWAEASGGRQGVGNDLVYNNVACFDPFPFPDLSKKLSLKARLADLGERLDAFRKERLAAHDFLTMTGLYNVLERVREVEWKAGPGRHNDNADAIAPLSDKERDIYEVGHVAILQEIHDEIDTLALAAFGWSDLAAELVGRPGATTPSPYKTDAQLKSEEVLLTRLVALNQERAAEEARGLVRWLRPDYQIPKLGHKVTRADGTQIEADLVIQPGAEKPKWPADNGQQITALVDLLRKAPAPMPPETLAASFKGRTTPKRRERVASLLETLTTIGLARSGRVEGENRYFIPR